MSGTDVNSYFQEMCSPEELERLVRERTNRLRQRTALRHGSVLATVLLIVLVGSALIQKTSAPSTHHYGGLACVEVRTQLAQYVVGNVDRKLTGRIKTHLEQCPDRGPSYRRRCRPACRLTGPRARKPMHSLSNTPRTAVETLPASVAAVDHHASKIYRKNLTGPWHPLHIRCQERVEGTPKSKSPGSYKLPPE